MDFVQSSRQRWLRRDSLRHR